MSEIYFIFKLQYQYQNFSFRFKLFCRSIHTCNWLLYKYRYNGLITVSTVNTRHFYYLKSIFALYWWNKPSEYTQVRKMYTFFVRSDCAAARSPATRGRGVHAVWIWVRLYLDSKLKPRYAYKNQLIVTSHFFKAGHGIKVDTFNTVCDVFPALLTTTDCFKKSIISNNNKRINQNVDTFLG